MILVIKKCLECSKQITRKAKRCLSCSNKLNGKFSSRMKGKKHSAIAKQKIGLALSGSNNPFYGKKHTESAINQMMVKQIKRWKKRSQQFVQNKCELVLEQILNELFPKEYKFTGLGEVWLGHFNPDFINCNGQKKIIEMYGDYWHNKPSYKRRDKYRLITYKELGYETLIVWEHELKDINPLKDKLISFHKF